METRATVKISAMAKNLTLEISARVICHMEEILATESKFMPRITATVSSLMATHLLILVTLGTALLTESNSTVKILAMISMLMEET